MKSVEEPYWVMPIFFLDQLRPASKFHQIDLEALLGERPLVHCYIEREVSRCGYSQSNREMRFF